MWNDLPPDACRLLFFPSIMHLCVLIHTSPARKSGKYIGVGWARIACTCYSHTLYTTYVHILTPYTPIHTSPARKSGTNVGVGGGERTAYVHDSHTLHTAYVHYSHTLHPYIHLPPEKLGPISVSDEVNKLHTCMILTPYRLHMCIILTPYTGAYISRQKNWDRYRCRMRWTNCICARKWGKLSVCAHSSMSVPNRCV